MTTTASLKIEQCVVCGGPFVSKRTIIEGRLYHERCAFGSYPPHTREDSARLTDEIERLRAALWKIDRINDHPGRFNKEINDAIFSVLERPNEQERTEK